MAATTSRALCWGAATTADIEMADPAGTSEDDIDHFNPPGPRPEHARRLEFDTSVAT